MAARDERVVSAAPGTASDPPGILRFEVRSAVTVRSSLDRWVSRTGV
jgi:hypothetical protein